MKLSIITINYNNADGLRRTMDSVIAQSFHDYEYIVIDGGSQDGSREVIEARAGHLAYWVSEPDGGIYNAMNKGIARAKGEYCLFLNSGDFLFNEQSLGIAFDRENDADIVSYAVINTDRKASSLKKPPCDVSLYTFLDGSLPHPSTFIRRGVFERVGLYNESYRIISDWAFFIDALIIHQCSYDSCDTVITVFDRSGGSISSDNPAKAKSEREHYLNGKFARVWKDYSLPEFSLNVLFFLNSGNLPMMRSLLLLPFRVLNRVFHLRNKLRKKISVEPVVYTFPE